LEPREKLTAMPYALHSNTAERAIVKENAEFSVTVGNDKKFIVDSTDTKTIAGNTEYFMVPKGGIIIWSGSINNIPEGWVLCDGNNGTPNLTDRFVLGAGHNYTVDSTGGESEHILPHELEFVYFDKVKDIALMHSDKLNSKINFSDGHVDTGERVYAIGNSKGYGLCIVDGLVSDNSRTVNGNEYIMISAPTTNGNSGGPLLNSRGELIGMVTAGDANVKTMNYAIPLKDILEFLDRVSKSEGINFNF